MKVCRLHRITALTMALLMLLTSTGYSVDVHYCQDKLKGVSLLGVAKSCHEKQKTPPCHKSNKSCQHQFSKLKQLDNDDCCHNETVVIEKSDLDATPTQLGTFQDLQLDFMAAFLAAYIFKSSVQANYQPNAQHKPPLPDRDIQVLYQTFLI